MVPHGGKRQSSYGQAPAATHPWQPWRAPWMEKSRPLSSMSCMRKAGTTTQRASPWPKSVSMGRSELCHCHRGIRPRTLPSGPRVCRRSAGSVEGLLEMSERQFHLHLDSSLGKITFPLPGKSLPLGLKARRPLPQKSPAHILPMWPSVAPPPSLPSLPGHRLVLSWTGLVSCRIESM